LADIESRTMVLLDQVFGMNKTDSGIINMMQLATMVLVLFSKGILYLKDRDLQQHTAAAAAVAGAPGVGLVSVSSPQCLLAHASPEL
jgi:hypothetical protein